MSKEITIPLERYDELIRAEAELKSTKRADSKFYGEENMNEITLMLRESELQLIKAVKKIVESTSRKGQKFYNKENKVVAIVRDGKLNIRTNTLLGYIEGYSRLTQFSRELGKSKLITDVSGSSKTVDIRFSGKYYQFYVINNQLIRELCFIFSLLNQFIDMFIELFLIHRHYNQLLTRYPPHSVVQFRLPGLPQE